MFSGILSPAQSRIAIPSCQDPGSPQWNEWQALGSSSVGIMIVNLNNGDDTTGPHSFLDAGVNLIELDAKALAQTHALDYQIRSLDPNGTTLFTGLLVPLGLDSTAYVFGVEDHGPN